MVEPAYSDERAEAFRAYMCLYGYKAAIDRCDWVAARRWFSEKEGEGRGITPCAPVTMRSATRGGGIGRGGWLWNTTFPIGKSPA